MYRKLKEIRDVAVQYDPSHASLPRVGVRLLLQVRNPFSPLEKIAAARFLVPFPAGGAADPQLSIHKFAISEPQTSSLMLEGGWN